MCENYIENKVHLSDECVESNESDFESLIKNVIQYLICFNDQSVDYSFPRLFDDKSSPSVLQPSLFPLVSPSLYFSLENESISSVPKELKPFLRWKSSSITANTMKAIITNSGFQLLKDKNKKSYKNWSAIWCKHLKSNEFKTIRENQKVNHFPGSFHFGRKDKLWLNLKVMALKHGFEVFANFHPQTFVLPQDLKLLKRYWMNSCEELVFILKPPASARGQGITLINSYSQIPKTARTKRKHYVKPTLIVQRYITNPCLLYNETKFDLRVYVLITSIVPLRVYLYDDGLVRFASNKYSSDSQNINNQFIHLTNYSVNKNNLNYVSNNDINGQTGNKWTLKTLWRYLNHSYKDVNVDVLWNSIEDMIIKTIISCESYIFKLVKQNLKSRYSSFELLGFDIMLDNDYKPWLLEVNISPSLRSDSSLDSAVKSQLIKDMFNINGYRIPPSFKKLDTFGRFICFNRHLYSTPLSNEEKIKQQKYEYLFNENGFSKTNDILSNLTDDDIRHLIESEDELSRSGSFNRIFPTFKTHEYLKYFDYVFYLNILLDNWEQQYHNNREQGIKLIRNLIYDRQHLFHMNSQTNVQLINYLSDYGVSDENFEENLLIEK